MEPLPVDPQRQEGVSTSSCGEDHCEDDLHSNNEGFTYYFINNICQTSLVVAIITVITGIIVTKLWRNTSTSAARRQGVERKEQGLKICGVKLEENKTSMREENKVSILKIDGDSSEEEEDINNILKLESLKLSDKKHSDHFYDKAQSSNGLNKGNLVQDVSSYELVDSGLSVHVSNEDQDPDHEPCVKETELFEDNSYRDVIFKNDASLQTFTACEVEATDEELQSVTESRPTDNYVREEKESLEETGDCSAVTLKDEDRQVIVSTQTETIIHPTTSRHLAPPKQTTIITSSVPAIITPRESVAITRRESATITPRIPASITPSSPARITPRSRRHKLLPLREMNILSDPADIDRSCSESVDFRVDPVTFHQVHKGSAVKSNPNGRSKKNRN